MVSCVRQVMDKVLADETTNLLVVDLSARDEDTLQILRWLVQLRPSLAMVLICDPGDVERSRKALPVGACNYLSRPVADGDLAAVLQRTLPGSHDALEIELRSDDVESVGEGKFFIAISPLMRRIRSRLALLAEANLPVLILGELGSGRETAARLLHKLSLRSAFRFAKVNCAALPEDLLARELFGYERSDVTASRRIVRGKLELCAQGTLFLDHIDHLPRCLQATLLQALESGEFIRPQSSERVHVDVRIVAASSVNLECLVTEGRFCPELSCDLSVCQVHIPPLRERRDEIPFLARHCLHRLARHYGVPPRSFAPATLTAWSAREWPGNLHEMEDLVKLHLLGVEDDLESRGGHIDPEIDPGILLPSPSNGHRPKASVPQPSSDACRPRSLRSVVQIAKSEAERNAIVGALEKTGWNRKAAARLLSVSYRSVLYKIEQYQLTSPTSSLRSDSRMRRVPSKGFPADKFDTAPPMDTVTTVNTLCANRSS